MAAVDMVDSEVEKTVENCNGNGLLPYDNVKNVNNENNRFQQRQGSTRRLIKVDYSVIQNTDDDEDDEEGEVLPTLSKSNSNFDLSPSRNNHRQQQQPPPNAMYRTGIVSVANHKNTSSSGDVVQQKYLRCSYDRTLERKPISSPFSTSLPTLKSSTTPPSCSIL